jgi:hypothetical protein
MTYCGHNNLWQCGNTDRTHPFSCNFSDTTKSDSTTFFMVDPTKLATLSVLPSTAPTTTGAKYIPTQWGTPQAGISSTSTRLAISPTSTQPAASGGGGLSGDALKATIGVVVGILGLVLTALTIYVTIYKEKARQQCSQLWACITCRS